LNLYIISTFIIYTVLVFVLTYYFNLFASKTEYTRSELSNIIPQLGSMISKIYSNYSLPGLTGIMVFSGIIGILIPSISPSAIINSCLLCLIFYFTVPRLAVYFEQTRVTISDNALDNIQNIFARYYRYILVGFNSGYASKIMYNWAVLEIISFPWQVINVFIITALSILILRDDIFHNL